MIHVFGRPDPPVPRLMAALEDRGHAVGGAAARVEGERSVLVLGPGESPDPAALAVLLGAWRKAPGARLLVLSLVGAHPDARSQRLRGAWSVEEHARGIALPALTLRLAPMIGPRSPLWLRLRSHPRLPRGGRQLLNPVAEPDVLETLERALAGRARWEGWYEVAGPEVVSLAELAELARAAGPPTAFGSGTWEPPLEEMEEHRLCEAGPWSDHFGIQPRPLAEQVAQWAA